MKIQDRDRKRKYNLRIFGRVVFFVCILISIFVIVIFNHKTTETIVIDKTPPEITLLGRKTVTILVGEEFKEPGFHATDNDENITNRVKTNSKIDNQNPGEYFVEYSVSDDSDNQTTIKRKVIVEKDYNFETKDPDFYFRSLENYIKQKGYKVSLAYYSISKNYTYKYNSEKNYYGASLIKPVAALYACEKLELDDDRKELVREMIEVSDNDAYIKIADIIGLDSLKQYGKSLGLTNFMMDKNNPYYSDTNLDNQLKLWKKIWQFVNSGNRGKELINFFKNDEENNIKFNDNIVALHKYGSWDEYFHDAGIIVDRNPYIIIVLTEEGEEKGREVIKKLSEKIYNFNKIIKAQ